MALPPGTRLNAYAGAELFLEIVHLLRESHGWDIETILIYYTIAEATMRPLVLGPEATPDLLDVDTPAEHRRGSISRLQIAERTGMPRETVRRKVNQLLAARAIHEAEFACLRSPPNLTDPAVQRLVQQTRRAVDKYHVRISAS